MFLNTRDKILLALASGKVVSGNTLARDLKMTRASVWKHAKALRAEGLPIQTHKRTGYRLKEPFDGSLLRERALDRGFWKLHYEFSCRSTQARAKQAGIADAGEGNLWLAEKQTAGKGRLDRHWESPFGGLWFSLLLRPRIAPAQVPALTLVAATALVDAIKASTGVALHLKWPNDLVARTPNGWRKVAGILTEMSAEVDRTHWVALGIGVNVNNPLPPNLDKIAISLSALAGSPLKRAKILKAFLNRFSTTYKAFQKRGFGPFRTIYWRRYSRPDEWVSLKTAQGLISGVARGVDPRGALVVESSNKNKAIWEGEIVPE